MCTDRWHVYARYSRVLFLYIIVYTNSSFAGGQLVWGVVVRLLDSLRASDLGIVFSRLLVPLACCFMGPMYTSGVDPTLSWSIGIC